MAHDALVTGAASGVGRAIAQRLAHDGATVLAADINAAGARAAGADVSDAEAVEAMFRAAEASGPVTPLVDVAGHVHQAPSEELALADFDRMIAVRLRGTLLCCRRAVPGMLARGGGAVVALSSIMGVAYGWNEHVHHSAAGSGVVGLVRGLAATRPAT